MLDALAQRPWTLPRMAREFAEIHSAMHAVRRPELPAQRESLERAIRYAPPLPDATRHAALTTLSALPDGDVVCHGDYHPDNLIDSARGPIVIDWMTATRGNPTADVARTVLLFRVGVLPEGMPAGKRIATGLFRRAFLAAYLRAYRAKWPLSDEEIAVWFPVLAAARLSERIPAEEPALLRLARSGLRM
jgi:Ser/Thr protein kinase RdoA (MazF antagonist)